MKRDLVGNTVGDYELVEFLGEGTSASVYKAYQSSLDRWVALKILHSSDPQLFARFEREAKSLAPLRHPNILMIVDYGIEDEWPYIVMEYVEQGTLGRYLYGKPLDPIQVARLGMSIAEALGYAHQQGLIHRDVKPSNILMPKADWPLLADFGLVRLKGASNSLTGSNITLGTPAYIAPEQVRSAKVDGRADMYSLGIVMYEMIAGRVPFRFKNLNALLLAHVSKAPPKPTKFNPKCPAELEHIILKALKKVPHDRYGDMFDLADALRLFAGETTVPLPDTPSASKPLPMTGQLSKITTQKEITAVEKEVHSSISGAKLYLQDYDVSFDLSDRGEETVYVIGRSSPKNPVDIDLNPFEAGKVGISRRHARIYQQDGDWFIEDLNSTNGTRLNRNKLTPQTSTTLRHDDVIRFGLLKAVFINSA